MTTEMRRWLLPVETSWHAQAACSSTKVAPALWRLFDPVDVDEEPKEATWARAQIAVDRFCLECPVMLKCAAEGAEHDYEGVWGGEFRERRGIIDLDTGLVIRGELQPVTPDETDEPAPDMPADMPPLEEPEPEPEPVELGHLTPVPDPAPEPEPRRRVRRGRRVGFRAPRRHRAPTVGVQLTLELPAVPRRRRPASRAINDPSADGRVAV